LGVGRWVLGVGSRGRVTPGSAGGKGVGPLPGRGSRAALAGPPPPDVAAAPHLAAAPPQNRADEMAEPHPTPKTPLGRQRGLDPAYIVTLTNIAAERKKKF
jgi:hypothetical protein